MKFDYEPVEIEFGQRLANWLRLNLPLDWRTECPPGSPEWFEFQRNWDRKLYEGGWAAYLWPEEHGGTPATAGQRMLYADLLAAYGAPDGLGKVGKRLVAPSVMKYGTDRQKEAYLGPILRGEVVWCQCFSEPGAGSDLGSLTTRATRRGDVYVVSGQKVWTSFAQWADYCYVLVRTGDPQSKHAGISVLLVDVDSPGLDVRPIHQINGADDFNEVFFDEVEVPVDRLLGEENRGWEVAMSLLAHERGAEMAFGVVASTNGQYAALARALAEIDRSDDRDAALVMGRAIADSLATQVMAARLTMGAFDSVDRGGMASGLRLFATVAASRGLTESLLTAPTSSLMTTPEGGGLIREWFTSRGGTIAGGTSEVQRETVARRLLRMDRGEV